MIPPPQAFPPRACFFPQLRKKIRWKSSFKVSTTLNKIKPSRCSPSPFSPRWKWGERDNGVQGGCHNTDWVPGRTISFQNCFVEGGAWHSLGWGTTQSPATHIRSFCFPLFVYCSSTTIDWVTTKDWWFYVIYNNFLENATHAHKSSNINAVLGQ